MLRQANNKVFIEGILSEIDLKYGSFNKDGSTMESISGTIKVKVETEINKEQTQLEIPVSMFAPKMTKKGAINPAYQSIEKVMTEFVSIAAAGEEDADRVRINGADIRMNEYWKDEQTLVSYPRINASFVNKISKDQCNPRAEFDVEFAVGNITAEVDNDGVETGRTIIKGIVPQWGGRVDIVDFITATPEGASYINSYWNQGDTVKAQGKLNFTAKTEIIYEEAAFGEPIKKKRTTNISELLITGGSDPLEETVAFDSQELADACATRKAELETRKSKDISRTSQKKAPSKSLNDDLGF